jgi:hypothetical protein
MKKIKDILPQLFKAFVSRSAVKAKKKYQCSACGRIAHLKPSVAESMNFCGNVDKEAHFILLE